MHVGWKQFYRIASSDFKSYYDRAQRWGGLEPYKVVIGPAEYYGAGLIRSPAEGQSILASSPKIQHVPGARTRITVKLIFYADAGTPLGCVASIYIMFYTNGDTAKDPQGNNAFGARLGLATVPGHNVAGLHEFTVEQSNNKIVLYLDGQRLGETTLSGVLQSFVLLVEVARYRVASEAEASVAQDAHGIVIYEVTGEYYDVWEDMFRTMAQMIHVAMFIAIGVMLLIMVFRAFIPRRERR
jgi:hypothetical protein